MGSITMAGVTAGAEAAHHDHRITLRAAGHHDNAAKSESFSRLQAGGAQRIGSAMIENCPTSRFYLLGRACSSSGVFSKVPQRPAESWSSLSSNF